MKENKITNISKDDKENFNFLAKNKFEVFINYENKKEIYNILLKNTRFQIMEDKQFENEFILSVNGFVLDSNDIDLRKIKDRIDSIIFGELRIIEEIRKLYEKIDKSYRDKYFDNPFLEKKMKGDK
jgi:hypothetical protein